ncbi:MAG: type II toxin-antitoxin system RelE/ParE family toxin [Actinomycetota bacterium]|nr:type II toxin-antitoxin system RelE/ParE family toxin [Actinomycetota bacterium]
MVASLSKRHHHLQAFPWQVEYLVLYRIRDDLREVIVVRIEHRRDACRPL